MAEVSVIICAYTEERFSNLIEAISSVHNQTVRPHEVIVVIDNNPLLLARVKDAAKDITLVQNTGARGLNSARNVGLAAARGDIVAFLDDDAIADPKWLEHLVEEFVDSHVLGVGGYIAPLWDAPRPKWFPDEFLWVVGCSYRGMPTSRASVRNLIGCNMAYRRQVCLEVGGFRTDIGHVGGQPRGDDETEFCIRLHQRRPSGVILFTPDARVYHHVPSTRVNWAYFRQRCAFEGASKATLVGLVGASDGLSSERSFAMRTLSTGVMRGIGDVIFRLDLSGIARAYALCLGLSTTACAYLSGRLRTNPQPEDI